MKTKYLIIGNSAGGIGAAEAIREVNKENILTIVSDESYPVYSRPLISKYLTGECTLDKMLYRPADFYAQNNVVFLPSRKVTHLESVIELFNWRMLSILFGRSFCLP